MSARRDKKLAARAAKKTAKQRRMEPGNEAPHKSKYAVKHAAQAHGHYRKTSPFYLSLAERERLDQLEAAKQDRAAPEKCELKEDRSNE